MSFESTDLLTGEEVKEFLTNKEAAAFLRSSEITLWRLRRSGELPFNRIASKVLYRRSDLEAFLKRNLRNGGQSE